MRNLKKSLALVLVFAMAMATMVGAAFTDVPANHEFTEEIEALTGLDIIQGMGNDKFAPDGTLTRAQAAAVIYRSMTGRATADVYSAATAFSDVAGSFWGAGYINYCTDMGVINGYPDGTFKPDAPVTYAEFTKMIVVALGADAGKNLVYPTGYIATAEMFKVLDDVSFVPGAPAKRADIAKIAYNAIFEAPYARKMIPGTVYNAGSEPKIASDVLKLNVSKVTISGIGKYYGTASDNADEIQLADIVAAGYDTYTGGKANYAGTLAPSSLGLSAIAYWKTVKGENVVYSITVEDTNKITTKATKSLKGLAVGTPNKVTWKTDNKDKVYTVDAAADFYINNELVTGAAAADFYTFLTNAGGLGLTEASGKVGANLINLDFINADNDEEFEAVKATVYDVYTVDSIDSKAIYTKEGTTFYLKDKDNEANPVTYPADLEKDDVIAVFADAGYGAVYTDAKDLKADIKLCEAKADVLFSGSDDGDPIFGGTTYVLSNQWLGTAFNINTATGKFDVTVDPIFGYVVKAEGTEAVTEYFLVTAADADPFSGNRIKGYNNEGKELTYKMKSGITYATKVDTAVFTNATTAVSITTPVITRISVNKDGQVTEIKDAITGITGIQTPVALSPSTGASAPFTPGKVLTKDSYKSTYKTLGIYTTTATAADQTAVDTTAAIDTYKVDSASVFFFKDPLKSDYYVYVGTFPSIGTISDGTINYKTYEGDKVITSAYLVGKPSGSSSKTSNLIGYVMANDVRVNADEEYYRVVKLLVNGEIKTYETETYTSTATVEGAKGNFVKFDLNTDGKIVNDGTNAFVATAGYLFGDTTATNVTAYRAVSKSDTAIGYETGDKLATDIPVATGYIKIDANTKFMIAESGSDIDDSTIGTAGSIVTKLADGTNALRTGSNLLVVFKDEKPTEVATCVYILK